ncbi:MAG: hypothetical protein DA446_06105 [Bacteroidetes bacterium]|nr:MAG: hypothetical protein DA443_05970 [Bacteroidota bacterium]PTM19902.1 MAG: hypothetical protein DA446_06105 [Bacteroidota bacterium]
MKKELFNPLYWKRSLLMSFLGLGLAVWFLFFDTYSLLTRVQLEWRKTELIEEKQQLDARAQQLRQELEELAKEDQGLEKIAREEYGMKKPGETVYKIEKPDR